MLGIIREIHPCVSDGESLVTPEMLSGDRSSCYVWTGWNTLLTVIVLSDWEHGPFPRVTPHLSFKARSNSVSSRMTFMSLSVSQNLAFSAYCISLWPLFLYLLLFPYPPIYLYPPAYLVNSSCQFNKSGSSLVSGRMNHGWMDEIAKRSLPVLRADGG